MTNERADISLGIKKIKVTKYAPGVTQEDIDAGKAEPYEIIIIEEDEL